MLMMTQRPIGRIYVNDRFFVRSDLIVRCSLSGTPLITIEGRKRFIRTGSLSLEFKICISSSKTIDNGQQSTKEASYLVLSFGKTAPCSPSSVRLKSRQSTPSCLDSQREIFSPW